MEKTNINPVIINEDYADYSEAFEHMISQGVKHLGWLNAGITLPENCNWKRVYKNCSGSSTLMVDTTKRLMYSVDMGD
jgi:hypothetical protein